MNAHRYVIVLAPHVLGYAATLEDAHRKITERPGRAQNHLRQGDYRVVDRWEEPGVVYGERMPKWLDLPDALFERVIHPDYSHTVDEDGNIAIWRHGSIEYGEGI